jgi:HAMP domain-containing protein
VGKKGDEKKEALETLYSRAHEYAQQIAAIRGEYQKAIEEIDTAFELMVLDAFAFLRDAALLDYMQISYGNERLMHMNYLRSSKERSIAYARWTTVRSWIMSGGAESELTPQVPGLRGVKTIPSGVLAYGRSEIERYMWFLDSMPIATAPGFFGYEIGEESLAFSLQRGAVIGYNTILIDKSDGMRQIKRNTRILLFYSSLIALVSVVLTYFFAGLMVKRIKAIINEARRVQSGDLSVMFPEKGLDEIDMLANSLNAMITGLRERESLKSELHTAAEIQKRLLPEKYPENLVEYYSIASYYLPMQGVGGDYYDFIELDRSRMLFCVGDVSNHGVGPA